MNNTDEHPSRTVLLALVVEKNDDGFLARVPGIQGAFAEGDTIEEAIFNCVDVIKMIAAYRAERGERLPIDSVEVTSDMRLAVSIPVELPA
jgi:predicted RNase H-like HicB family nuclease